MGINHILDSGFRVPQLEDFSPKLLEGRLAPGVAPERFLEDLLYTQAAPCPWGSLVGNSSNALDELFWELDPSKRPKVPLALELGSGLGYMGIRCGMAFARRDRVIYSDWIGPEAFVNDTRRSGVPDDQYVQIDLTKPETINVGGLRFSWIGATKVFCDQDEAGKYAAVVWPDVRVIPEVLNRLFDMLLPNGILYLDPYFFPGLNLEEYAQRQGMNFFHVGNYCGPLVSRCMVQKPA